MDRTYAAFISYRHKSLDITTAKTLHSLIEQYRIPKSLRKDGKKRLGIVFRDQDELSASSNLTEKICQALDHTEFLIVICTPDSKQSVWVEREINYFLQHHDRSRVLAVLAAGEPDEAFPTPLTQQWNAETGQMETIEPLAVDIRAKDVRSSMAALRREVKRIFAAMLGCPYDALILREQRRKRRRVVGFLSAALAVALSFSAVLIVKNRQIDQKNLELEDKNVELAKQRADVLLRESELLTQNADAALAEHRYLDAIAYSIDALPGGTETDRPYYADAERTLLSALDLLGTRTETTVIADTPITQMTPIHDFCVSTDGSKLITMDPYNLLCCYDTQTSQLLWSTHQEASNAYMGDAEPGRFFPCYRMNTVIVCYDSLFTAYDMDTGAAKWTFADSACTEEFIFLRQDEGQIAYVRKVYGESFEMADFMLVILDTATGKPLQQVTILEQGSIFDTYFGILGTPSNAGALSSDGKYFAGMYFLLNEEDTYDPVYFLADLETGTCRTVYTDEACSYYFNYKTTLLAFSEDSSSLLIAKPHENKSIATSLIQISTADGNVLWQAESAPMESDGYFQGKHSCIVPSTNYVYVGRGDQFYCFSRKDGQLIAEASLPGEICSLFFVGDNFLGYVTTDGYYAICWRNNSGFYDSSYYHTTADLGQAYRTQPWGDGFIQGIIVDNSISEIIKASEAGQFMAVQPEKGGNTILIKRVVDLGTLRQIRSVPLFLEDVNLYTPGIHTMIDGTLALEQLCVHADSQNSYYCQYIDPADNSILHTQQLHIAGSLSHVYYLPDGSGYLLCDSYGTMLLYPREGEPTELSQGESVALSQTEDMTFMGELYVSQSAVRSADQALISVRCGGDHLELWQNGQAKTTVTLPEGLIWQHKTNAYFQRILAVGENGYVVLSNFEGEDSSTIASFAVYDTATGTWIQFEDQAHGSYERTLRLGETSPLMAIIDADSLIRIYDLQTGQVLTSFSPQLPSNSFVHLEFILEDGYLMARTEDSQILIYDIATGQIRYRQQLGSSSSSTSALRAYPDFHRNRLYIADTATFSPGTGICLDTATWTKLMDLPGFVGYDAATNQVYLYGRYTGITACTIPATDELVAMGKGLLP